MLARLARFCVRRKWIVVFAIWVPLLIVVNIAAGAAGSAFSTDFTPPDSESADVIEQIAVRFLADRSVDRVERHCFSRPLPLRNSGCLRRTGPRVRSGR